MPRVKEAKISSIEELDEIIKDLDQKIDLKKSQIENWKAQIIKAEQSIREIETKKSLAFSQIIQSPDIPTSEKLEFIRRLSECQNKVEVSENAEEQKESQE